MSKKSNMLSTFLKFSYGSVIALGISLISTPMITRIYDPTEYGKLSLYNNYFSLLSTIVFFGLDQAYIRYYYSYNKNDLLQKTAKIPFFASLIICVCSMIVGKDLSIYLFGEHSIAIFTLAILKIIFIVPNRFALQTIRMEKLSNQYSAINIIEKATCVAIAIIAGTISAKYSSLVIAYTISYCTSTIIAIVILRTKTAQKQANQTQNEISSCSLYHYALPLMPHFALYMVIQSSDKLLIKQFCSYAELGIYQSAFAFVSALLIIQTAFTAFWTPISLEKYSSMKDESQIFIQISNIVSFCMCSIELVICMTAKYIVLLLGPKYESAAEIIPVLTLIPVFYTISEATLNGIVFMCKTYMHIVISLVAATFCVVINVLLIPRIGLLGAAIATSGAYYIILILRTVVSDKLYPVGYRKLRVIIQPGILFAIAICISFFKNDTYRFAVCIAYLIMLICLNRRTIKVLINEVSKMLKQCKLLS